MVERMVRMDKGKLNFLIDALMFLCMAGIAGIGFLMKYVLLPRSAARALYGRRVELSWLGWDRHDWGEVHLYLAFLFLGLLVLHIILHWDMIVGLFKRFFANAAYRPIIMVSFVCLCVVLFLFAFFIQPDIEERGPGKGRGQGRVESREQAPKHLAALTHFDKTSLPGCLYSTGQGQNKSSLA